mmetsp:Transcript_76194/g.150695  ORF Transcript_76194/g.150695 Transcript_76194/m.150695 type:complete len:239 (-) Transcript_76194:1048-1764(-)
MQVRSEVDLLAKVELTDANAARSAAAAALSAAALGSAAARSASTSAVFLLPASRRQAATRCCCLAASARSLPASLRSSTACSARDLQRAFAAFSSACKSLIWRCRSTTSSRTMDSWIFCSSCASFSMSLKCWISARSTSSWGEVACSASQSCTLVAMGEMPRAESVRSSVFLGVTPAAEAAASESCCRHSMKLMRFTTFKGCSADLLRWSSCSFSSCGPSMSTASIIRKAVSSVSESG